MKRKHREKNKTEGAGNPRIGFLFDFLFPFCVFSLCFL